MPIHKVGMRTTGENRRQSFPGRILDYLPAILGLAVILSLLLPAFIGRFGGYLYYVRGIDMVFGRGIEGDQDGIIPQVGECLVAVCLVLGLLCLLLRNRMRALLLNGILSAIALLLHSTLPGTLQAFTSNLKIAEVAYGYYVTEIGLVLLLVSGIVNIGRNGNLRKELRRNTWLYVMGAIVVTYCLIFFYYPMYGLIIAFKDYSPRLGIVGSKWVGFEHFKSFFRSYFFGRLIRNTLSISLLDIAFGFTTPIIFALFLNEVKGKCFKSVIQTVTYMPYFVSLVVICGLLVDFLGENGLITSLLASVGFEKQNYLLNPRAFQGIYTASSVWQNMGWNSIVYLAALSGIDETLYEAAAVDGANRWHKMWRITLPCLMPTIIIMLIMRLGSIMSVGHEKIILLYGPATYETADVISSFVYRRGIIEMGYSFSTAVSLFNSVINFALLLAANKLSRKYSEVSLW